MSRQVLDIAVVTSCHNYGRYLKDWARSIASLTRFVPSICAIVDNGSTDTTPHEVKAAAAILEGAGIACVTERMAYANFGAARNRAVQLSGSTEWVVHLDADDMFMPHFLEDFAALMHSADVVGAGYKRTGDLKAGPRNRTRVYSAHQGTGTLRSTAPCSGVSPFKRSLWEQSPYRTDMRGGWDTALWIGFAHLNARFVPTRRPVFLYRQHADSVFNMRWPNARKTHFVGVKLGNLRRKIDSGVSVVVPYRPDGAERDEAWRWLARRYAALHPDWEVVLGNCPDGEPWSKGTAVADGIQRSRCVTLVIADADVYVAPEALEEAVHLVKTQQAEWVIPHRKVHRLHRVSTADVLASDPATHRAPEDPTYQRKPYDGYAGGGIVVIDRSDYEASGGIPKVFRGWGAEDECLAVILDTLIGPNTRLSYDLWHLWHSPVKRMRHVQYKDNRTMLRVFLQHMGNPEAMWELVQHTAAGGDPTMIKAERTGGVMMVALEGFTRGTEWIDQGVTFRCSEQEARRHEARPRKVAARLNASSMSIARMASKERTLDIRAEQAERNEAARRELQRRQDELKLVGGRHGRR